MQSETPPTANFVLIIWFFDFLIIQIVAVLMIRETKVLLNIFSEEFCLFMIVITLSTRASYVLNPSLA